jgi:hypothetical protein
LIGVDVNGVPELLKDADGATEWSLPVASSDVAKAANLFFTGAIEVDLQNSAYLYPVVKTAATGTAFTDSDAAIMVKLK